MDGLEGARHTVFPLWPLPVNSPQVHKNCSDVPMSRLKGPQGNGAGWTQHLQEDLGGWNPENSREFLASPYPDLCPQPF